MGMSFSSPAARVSVVLFFPACLIIEQRFLREVVEANGVVACARGFDQRFLGLVGREVAMDMPAEYLDGLFGCQNHGGQGAAGTGWSCDEVAGRPTNGSCDLRIPELEDGQACVRTTVAAPRAVRGLRGVVRSRRSAGTGPRRLPPDRKRQPTLQGRGGGVVH